MCSLRNVNNTDRGESGVYRLFFRPKESDLLVSLGRFFFPLRVRSIFAKSGTSAFWLRISELFFRELNWTRSGEFSRFRVFRISAVDVLTLWGVSAQSSYPNCSTNTFTHSKISGQLCERLAPRSRSEKSRKDLRLEDLRTPVGVVEANSMQIIYK